MYIVHQRSRFHVPCNPLIEELEVQANSLRKDLEKLAARSSLQTEERVGLFFCPLPDRLLGNWMKMGVYCAALFFCTNGSISWREIKQRQLNDAFDAGPATCGCLLRGFPVEQPARSKRVN